MGVDLLPQMRLGEQVTEPYIPRSEYAGQECPICSDKMTMNHDNLLPTWSDEYDNVVCWWCATRVAFR